MNLQETYPYTYYPYSYGYPYAWTYRPRFLGNESLQYKYEEYGKRRSSMSDCIFCKIVAKQIPAKIVYEDDQVVCFHDIQPVAPVHVLLIPKKHVASHHDLQEEDWSMVAHLHKVAQQIASEQGIAQTGYRLVNNCGSDAGQVVFHYHLHLLGGSRLTFLGHLE